MEELKATMICFVYWTERVDVKQRTIGSVTLNSN